MRHEGIIPGESKTQVPVLEGEETIRVYVGDPTDGVRLDVQRTEKGIYVRSSGMMITVSPHVANAVYVDVVDPDYRPGGKG